MNLTRTPTAPRCFEQLERPIESESEPFLVVDSDPWGGPYRIDRDGDGEFRVCCNGPDGQSGTEDDIGWPEH